MIDSNLIQNDLIFGPHWSQTADLEVWHICRSRGSLGRSPYNVLFRRMELKVLSAVTEFAVGWMFFLIYGLKEGSLLLISSIKNEQIQYNMKKLLKHSSDTSNPTLGMGSDFLHFIRLFLQTMVDNSWPSNIVSASWRYSVVKKKLKWRPQFEYTPSPNTHSRITKI